MSKRILPILLLFCLFMTSCYGGRSIKPSYPLVTYRNSEYNFDPFNREIQIDNGYVLDEGHSYDVQETENGYDIVLHFVKGADK